MTDNHSSNENNMINKGNLLIKVDLFSILKLLLFLLAIIFVYLIRDVIILFLGAIIISFVFSPIVNFLEKKRVTRLLSTIMVYLFVLLVVTGIIIPLVPLLTKEFNLLIERLPNYYDKLNYLLNISDKSFGEIVSNFLRDLISQPAMATRGIFGVLGTVFGWVFVAIMIFVIAFYLTLQKTALQEFFQKIVPEKYRSLVVKMAQMIQKDIGGWARGLLLGAIAVGIINYIGLTIIGVKFALVLAVISAVLEFIPWIGPWIAGIIAVAVALIDSPVQALIVAAFYLVIQQIQGNLIMPKVMQKTVGLDPLLVILVLLVGSKLGGVVGMILAIPLLTIIIIIIREYLELKKEINGVKNK